MISKILGSNKRAFWLVFSIGGLHGIFQALLFSMNPLDVFSTTIGTGLAILVMSLFFGGISLGIERFLEKVGVLKSPDLVINETSELLDDTMIIKEEKPAEKVSRIWQHAFVWALIGTGMAIFDFLF